ncbi:hypothetical protein FRB99_001212 [Tulasnella sp. 403]|nr:hypothetical protein FRB99_001212 [Tulasnella sp. 403]
MVGIDRQGTGASLIDHEDPHPSPRCSHKTFSFELVLELSRFIERLNHKEDERDDELEAVEDTVGFGDAAVRRQLEGDSHRGTGEYDCDETVDDVESCEVAEPRLDDEDEEVYCW